MACAAALRSARAGSAPVPCGRLGATSARPAAADRLLELRAQRRADGGLVASRAELAEQRGAGSRQRRRFGVGIGGAIEQRQRRAQPAQARHAAGADARRRTCRWPPGSHWAAPAARRPAARPAARPPAAWPAVSRTATALRAGVYGRPRASRSPRSALLRVSSHRPWRATQWRAHWPAARPARRAAVRSRARTAAATASPACTRPVSKASSTTAPCDARWRDRRRMSVRNWQASTGSAAPSQHLGQPLPGGRAGMQRQVQRRRGRRRGPAARTLCSRRVMASPPVALSVCTQRGPSRRSRSATPARGQVAPGGVVVGRLQALHLPGAGAAGHRRRHGARGVRRAPGTSARSRSCRIVTEHPPGFDETPRRRAAISLPHPD